MQHTEFVFFMKYEVGPIQNKLFFPKCQFVIYVINSEVMGHICFLKCSSFVTELMGFTGLIFLIIYKGLGIF